MQCDLDCGVVHDHAVLDYGVLVIHKLLAIPLYYYTFLTVLRGYVQMHRYGLVLYRSQRSLSGFSVWLALTVS